MTQDTALKAFVKLARGRQVAIKSPVFVSQKNDFLLLFHALFLAVDVQKMFSHSWKLCVCDSLIATMPKHYNLIVLSVLYPGS